MRWGALLPHRALRVGTVILVAAGLALVVTGAAARPAGGPAKGGILRLGRFVDVGTLDPALSYFAADWQIEYATCAKLFNNPDKAGAAGTRVVPEVVQRFTISRDRRDYTFALKRTFRFQTGEPVDAASFAAAFNRDADPALNSPAALYLHDIVGADAVIGGRARTISGVRVLGPYRLRIRLTRPLGDLPARLTMPFFCPIPPGTPRRELSLPPGSGPYYVAEHVAHRRIVLRRNPYYRGARPAYVDEVDYRLGFPTETCIAATEKGEIDQCSIPFSADASHDPNRDLAQKYGVNKPGGRYFVAPQLGTYYLAFNHDRPAFKDDGQVPLARAINYAIDREALAAETGAYGARATDRMLPPAIGRDEHYYPLARADAVTARMWFAKAKYKPKKLVLYTWNSQNGVHVAGVLTENLRQLGIELEVKYFSPAVLPEKVGTRGEPFDIVWIGFIADYADPAGFLRPLLHGDSLRATGNSNVSYLDDPHVNAAIDAADRLTGAARRKAFADLDASLMRDDPPLAPAFNFNDRKLVSTSVGCFFIHPVVGVDPAAVCKRQPP